MANKVLVLDAGHGYHTIGKRTKSSLGTVCREWTLNNSVCKYIEQELADYNVTIYRTDDKTGSTDVPLQTRVLKANGYKPDLFISIHHNAGGGTGTEVYWHTKGTAADKKVANIIAPKLAKETGLRNRGVKQASFTVLTCKYTAILIEGGFMDTANDYKIIITEKGQKAYARAVAQGVIEYLGLTKKVVPKPTPTKPTTGTTYKVGSYNKNVKTTDSLNIRSKRNASSSRVGTLPKGTTVKVNYIMYQDNSVAKKGSLWGSVFTSHGDGYICMDYTTPTTATTTVATKTTTTSTKTVNYKVEVTASSLNIRKGAGTNYSVTGTVRKGQVYTIVEEKDGWGKLKSGAGWISLKYVKKL